MIIWYIFTSKSAATLEIWHPMKFMLCYGPPLFEQKYVWNKFQIWVFGLLFFVIIVGKFSDLHWFIAPVANASMSLKKYVVWVKTSDGSIVDLWHATSMVPFPSGLTLYWDASTYFATFSRLMKNATNLSHLKSFST